MAFIFVAIRERSHQKDFEYEFRLFNRTASRSISFWCHFAEGSEKGMDLIDRREDAQNRIFRFLTLTKKGQLFSHKLVYKIHVQDEVS